MNIEQLRLYKTAYSVLDECRVEIVKVWLDEKGKPLLRCQLQSNDEQLIFREEELAEFGF